MKKRSHFFKCFGAIGLLLVLLAVPVQSISSATSCVKDSDCPGSKICIGKVCGEEIVVTAPATVPILIPQMPIDPLPPTYSQPVININVIIPTNPHDQDDNGRIDCWNQLTGDTSLDINSPVGYRTHPIRGTWEFHNGIDIGVPTGTIVRAGQSGSVNSIEYGNGIGEGSGSGNYFAIDNDDGTQSWGIHMWQIYVREGDRVNVGQILGNSDNTGGSTGAHFHYSIRREGHDGDTSKPENYHDPEEYYGSDCG